MSSSSKFPRKEKVGIVYKLDSNLCKHKSRKKEFKYALSESIGKFQKILKNLTSIFPTSNFPTKNFPTYKILE